MKKTAAPVEQPTADLARMFDWLVWALVCYVLVFALRWLELAPQAQTVLWKLGNLTVAAYAGYWLDRRIFRSRITDTSPPLREIRRAIVVAAAMLTVGLGL